MIVEKAYAKINLGLEVIRKREDSFHELAMVMTSISLNDELFFESIDQNKVFIDSKEINHIKTEDNLVYKAAMLLKDKFNITKGVRIRVRKNIPERSGLGGGSADAAATLRGLNKLWKLNLSLDELAEYGLMLGSDVPFCIYNKTAKVTGRGEVIEFIDDIPYFNLVLVIPQFSVSTKEVFENFKIHNRNKGKIDRLVDAISSKDIDLITENLFNDLERSYYFREISKIKSELISAGAKAALMTGSGSAVFAICLNEKDANIVNKRFLGNRSSYKTMLVQTRSNIKYNWNGQTKKQNNNKVLAKTRSKAFAYLPLAYQRIQNDFIIIETPLNNYGEISIEKINNKISEVYINNELDNGRLKDNLKILVDNLDYGLRIKIKSGLYLKLKLINDANYLATIINSLEEFDENIEPLYNLFPERVRAYRGDYAFHYRSKNDQLEILETMPFGYILIADLGIKNYRNPKYTKQIVEGVQIKNMIEGIKESDFYKIADNLYNSLAKFDKRNIKSKRQIDIEKIKSDSIKFGAQGCVLSVDGNSIVCVGRAEKHLKGVEKVLKSYHKIKTTLFTSFKSDISHKGIESSVLIEIPAEVKDEIARGLFIHKEPVEEDYSRYDFDDYTNPFGVEIPISSTYKSKDKKVVSKEVDKDRDIEGLLYIHSGGSLFKQYDFKDIAVYFERYFHNKLIEFKIEDKSSFVGFRIENLPHLLGIHKIDPSDDTLKGRSGFKRLIDDEISYDKLKNELDEDVFLQIIERTQSSVLIFNDIFHGRDRNFICYDSDVLIRDDSLLKGKLKYGITRAVAGNRFHERNVLGIGYEEKSDVNYFVTSYVWEAQASLGKKEGYRVEIVKT